MTTICYRDGVMASDTRAWGVDKAPVGRKHKSVRLSDGSLLGVSSAIIGCSKIVREWIEAGMDAKDLPVDRDKSKVDFDAILVRPNGSCILIDGNWMPSDPVTAPFYAIGSGKDFALAALVLGETAASAVKVASQLDAWTGDEVSTVSHAE